MALCSSWAHNTLDPNLEPITAWMCRPSLYSLCSSALLGPVAIAVRADAVVPRWQASSGNVECAVPAPRVLFRVQLSVDLHSRAKGDNICKVTSGNVT